LINLESGRVERTVDLQSGTIRKVLFDPRTERAIVGFESGTISSVALPHLRALFRLEGAHQASIELMELSRDGAILATSGGGHIVVLRDPANGKRLLELETVITNPRGITFDLENRLIMVGSDSFVDVWDLSRLRKKLLDLGLDW
jgi:WD40 repeat protein